MVFRVRGITVKDGHDDDAQLRSALSEAIISCLEGNERSALAVTVTVVPSCYGSTGRNKICLVDCRGGVPSFLRPTFEDPGHREFQMEMGGDDVIFDCHFFDLTQLSDATVPITAE